MGTRTVTEEDGVVMKLGKLVAKGVAEDVVDAEVDTAVEAPEKDHVDSAPFETAPFETAQPVTVGSSAER